MSVEGTRLEARGPILGLHWVKAMHAGAAHIPRANIEAFGHSKTSRSLRAHQRFVTSEADYVQPLPDHVDGDDTRALRGVNDANGPDCVRDARDTRDIHSVAGDV